MLEDSERLANCLGQAVIELLSKTNTTLRIGDNSAIRFTNSKEARSVKEDRSRYVPRYDSGSWAILMALREIGAVDRRFAISRKDLIQAANLFRSRPLTMTNQYVSSSILVQADLPEIHSTGF